MHSRVRTPRPRLTVHPLEARDVPAGTVTASVIGTVLTLTGDDLANDIGIHRDAVNRVVVTGAGTTLAGTGGTLSGGPPANVFTTTSAAITRVRVLLKGGDDVARNDTNTAGGDSPFTFTGGLFVDNGDGNNTLSLDSGSATTPVALGGLTYRGGDGSDSLTIGSASVADNKLGAVNVNIGVGGTDNPTTFAGEEVTMTNAQVASVVFTAGEGDEEITLDRLTPASAAAPPPVTVNGGNGPTRVTVWDSTVGAVAVRAWSASLTLIDVTYVPGALSTGTVTVAGGPTGGAALTTGAFGIGFSSVLATRSVSVTGGAVSADLDGVLTVTGNVNLTAGKYDAVLESSTSSSVVNVTGGLAVRAGAASSLRVHGNTFNVGGAVAVSGGDWVNAQFSTDAESKVGSLTATGGGVGGNELAVNRHFRTTGPGAAGFVRVAFQGGGNRVELGQAGTAGAQIGGLTIVGGAGADTININRVTITGPAVIQTGTGADALNFNPGATFNSTLSVDQGTGDDALVVGGAAGAGNAVTFSGKVTARQGAGNDTLTLDLASGFNVFGVAGNLFDGGPAWDDNGSNPDSGTTGNVSFLNYETLAP